jgi:hypothetical protein
MTIKKEKFEPNLTGNSRTPEDVMKIARRITQLIRELEAHSLDMAFQAKPLATGKFPVSHLVQVENSLTSFENELRRIKQAWVDLFKEWTDGDNSRRT